MERGIWFGLLSFAIYYAGQVLGFRLVRVRHRSRFMALLLLFSLVVLGTVCLFWNQRPFPLHGGRALVVAELVAGLATFFGLFVLYMPFYYTIQTSISVTMLVRLLRDPRPGVPILELRPSSNAEDAVRQRMSTMADNGYLERAGNRFRLRPRGRIVSRVFSLLQRLWGLGPGG